MPSPAPSAAPSIRPGNVGDDEALVRADAHDAEMRLQRRERIVGDARRGRRDRADEGGFARVREAEQADVGEYLQFEAQVAHLAFGARSRLARRTVDRTLEIDVAGAAVAAFCDLEPLPVRREVADQLVGGDVDDRRADRHADDLVLAGLACHLPAHAALPALRAKYALVAKVDQGVEALVRDEPDAAAVAAVAAVRPAERDGFLATETHATVAAVAGMYGNFGFVDEFHGWGLMTEG